MGNNSGYLVSYYKRGELQRGKVIAAEQDQAFKKINKSLVRLCDEDFNDERDPANGKRLIALMSNDKLTTIGFID